MDWAGGNDNSQPPYCTQDTILCLDLLSLAKKGCAEGDDKMCLGESQRPLLPRLVELAPFALFLGRLGREHLGAILLSASERLGVDVALGGLADHLSRLGDELAGLSGHAHSGLQGVVQRVADLLESDDSLFAQLLEPFANSLDGCSHLLCDGSSTLRLAGQCGDDLVVHGFPLVVGVVLGQGQDKRLYPTVKVLHASFSEEKLS